MQFFFFSPKFGISNTIALLPLVISPQQLPLHQPSTCQPHLVMRPGLTSPVLLPSPTQAGPSPLTMLPPPTSPCQLSTSLQPCLTCSLPTTYLSISKLLTPAQSLHIIGSAGLFGGEGDIHMTETLVVPCIVSSSLFICSVSLPFMLQRTLKSSLSSPL